MNPSVSQVQPAIPAEVQNRVPRGKYGKWVFCLGEYNLRKWQGGFKLREITGYTNEASAIIYFKKYLESGNYFLIKIPEVIAHLLKRAEDTE